MRKLFTLLAVLAVVSFSSYAYADDAVIDVDINGVGPGVAVNYEHEDGEPFKGWVDVSVTNTGTEAWGDFHFEIFQVGTYGPIDNIDFIDYSPYEPTSSQVLDSWAIDNVSVGAKMDLYFYNDPVNPGESATFKVYTDNTTNNVTFFGVSIYPTPVPEPTAAVLLGLGSLALLRKRG